MIRWTGLAPWEFELPFPGNLTSTCLDEAGNCFRATREQLARVSGLLRERQSQNLALTALCVPYSLDSSSWRGFFFFSGLRWRANCHVCAIFGRQRCCAVDPARACLRFRGGLVFKAHRLFVSINSRFESNKEEENSLSAKEACPSHHLALPHSHSLSDYSQVDKLGSRYKFVNFGAEKGTGSPNWWSRDRAKRCQLIGFEHSSCQQN